MKAVAVNPAKRSISVLDHPRIESLGATEARLKLLDVGVCGTDKEIARFDYGTPPKGSDYLVIGHESLGQVVETGSAVKHVKKGDLVVTMVRRPCDDPSCSACRAGRQDFCFTGRFTERGISGRHGFMTEETVDDEKYMHVVPSELRDVGVLTEPLTIAEKAMGELERIHDRLPWTAGGKFRDFTPKALVLGAGPVGLLGAMSLLVAGFETYVYSREPIPSKKSELCDAIGAKYITGQSTNVDELAKKIGNIDAVYEATGASRFSFEALKQLGPNGVFVFTGVPGRKGPSPVDTDILMRNIVLKNQVLLGSVNAGADAYRRAISQLGEFHRRWPTALRALITARHPITEAPSLLQKDAGGIKHVISLEA